jgi:ADP-heptose:LPS heptosyltransferase
MPQTIILQRMGALGDVLNATPVLRRLRQENPEAFIDVVTAKLEVFRNNPHLTSLSPGRTTPYYDRSVILDMVYERNRYMNQTDSFMQAAFGDTEGDKTPFLAHDPFPPEGLPLLPWTRVVVMHPNRSWEPRTFPQVWWQTIADKLVSRGYVIVVTGTVIDHAIRGKRVLDTRAKLSLARQASLIENAACAICGPSGIANLAACTEAPIALICNMTRAEQTLHYRHGELGWNTTVIRTPLDCYGCSELQPPNEFFGCRLNTNACTTSLSVDSVVEAVEQAILKDRRKST